MPKHDVLREVNNELFETKYIAIPRPDVLEDKGIIQLELDFGELVETKDV